MGYDAQPFKVRPCELTREDCASLYPDRLRILARDLPDPGVALPSDVDHWHVLPRGGGDNRGARDLQKWKTIALAATRCEHGRVQLDVCYGCPEGHAPDKTGTRIGTAYSGRAVVVPPREKHNEPEAWYDND